MIAPDARPPRWMTWAIVLAPAIIAMTLQLIATARYGPGLAPDSAVYLNAAGQLAAGKGFTQRWPSADGVKSVPVTWYPPAYPTVLSIAPRLGISAVTFARFTSTFLLGIATSLGCLMTVRASRSIIATIVVGAILCCSIDQIENFAYALSEPLFIVATLLALLSMARYSNAGARRWLLAAACMASLAGMTRYVGLVLVPVGATVLLVTSPKSMKRRLFDSALFVGIASAANTMWFVRNAHFAGSATGRAMQWHPVALAHAQSLFDTLTRWTLATMPPTRLWPVGVVAAVFAVVVIARASVSLRRNALFVTLALFIVAYLVGLAASITWIDAATPVDSRLLSTVYVPFVILLVYAWRSMSNRRAANIVFGVLASVVLIANAYGTTRWVYAANARGDRLAYASKRWETSRAMKAMRKLDPNVPVLTNAPDAMFLHGGRVDSLIPARYVRDGDRVLDTYEPAIRELREGVIHGTGGAIVYWRGVNRRGAPSIEDLDRDLAPTGLTRLEYRGDAIIWAHPATAKKLARWVPPTTRSSE